MAIEIRPCADGELREGLHGIWHYFTGAPPGDEQLDRLQRQKKLNADPDAAAMVRLVLKVAARGEVVIVSGSYGVRILEVVSASDRIRSMEV